MGRDARLDRISRLAESVEDALAMARDAIELSISVRLDEGAETSPSDAGATRLETVIINHHAA